MCFGKKPKECRTLNKEFRMKKCILIVILFYLIPSLGYGQYSLEPDKVDEDFIVSGFSDFKEVVISPVKWDQKEWMIAGATVLIGAGIYHFDDNIRSGFQDFRGSGSDKFSKYVLDPFGKGFYPLVLFAGMYLAGSINENAYTQSVALNATKTFAIAAVTAFGIKQLTGRQRPSSDHFLSPRSWSGPFSGGVDSSFPSIHTTTSFALASFLSSAYPDKKWVGIASYSMATLVGLSRLNDNQHWASDVFVGAVIGYGIGKLVHSNMLKRAGIIVIPVSQVGLGLTLLKRL